MRAPFSAIFSHKKRNTTKYSDKTERKSAIIVFSVDLHHFCQTKGIIFAYFNKNIKCPKYRIRQKIRDVSKCKNDCYFYSKSEN